MRSSTVTPDPAIMVDAMETMSGLHPGYRRAHARGRCFEATFVPSGAAAPYTTAAHLQHDSVPAIVRFSNTSGDPCTPDGGSAMRGMSVKFLAPETDLVSLNTPVFMASTPDKFLHLTRLLTTLPQGSKEWADAVVAFIMANPESVHAFQEGAAIPVPASYATARFWALHAFAWIAPDGVRRFVRYRWEPRAGFRDVTRGQVQSWSPEHLTDEFVERLERTTVSFTLKVRFAGPGDSTEDPTQAWPDDREEIDAGRLDITAPVVDEEVWDAKVFDPTRLVPGIELSDDPVLAYRGVAYAEGHRRRSAGC